MNSSPLPCPGLQRPLLPERMNLDQQIREIEREIQVRRGVYPRLIQAGKLTHSTAVFRQEALYNVQETLTSLRTVSLLSADAKVWLDQLNAHKDLRPEQEPPHEPETGN